VLRTIWSFHFLCLGKKTRIVRVQILGKAVMRGFLTKLGFRFHGIHSNRTIRICGNFWLQPKVSSRIKYLFVAPRFISTNLAQADRFPSAHQSNRKARLAVQPFKCCPVCRSRKTGASGPADLLNWSNGSDCQEVNQTSVFVWTQSICLEEVKISPTAPVLLLLTAHPINKSSRGSWILPWKSASEDRNRQI